MKIYHHPNCSSCKKALAHLRRLELDFELVNIIDQPPTQAELEQMLAIYAGNIKRLFNTSGQAYREADLKSTLPSMSAATALATLAANGMLVKRPFILTGQGTGMVGYNEAMLNELLA